MLTISDASVNFHLKKAAANLTNVYQKLLTATRLRASSVFSDVRGLAATAILEDKLNTAPDFAETVIEKSSMHWTLKFLTRC